MSVFLVKDFRTGIHQALIETYHEIARISVSQVKRSQLDATQLGID